MVAGGACDDAVEQTELAEEAMYQKPKARRGGRTSTPRRCSLCLQVGHNRAGCTRG